MRASLSSYRKLCCVKHGVLLCLAKTPLRLIVYETALELH